MLIIESAGLSDIGKKRRDNEDRMLVNDNLRLYAVADGMGGHQAGEVASQMALDTLRSHIQHPPKNGLKTLLPGNRRLSRKAQQLLTAIELSNQTVHKASRSNKAHRGMGTTVAAICFTNKTIIAANVGDSIIHMIRNGEISMISVEHTLLAEQAAVNDAFAERLGRELSHVLTRAIGTHAQVKIDIFELECFSDDIFVISSDGLTDKAKPAEIKAIVEGETPRDACRRLVDLANARGGDDNITAVVVKVKRAPAGLSQLTDTWRRWVKKIRKTD